MRHPKSSLGTGPHSSTRTFANQPLAYTSTSKPCASSPKPASNANVIAAISSTKPRPPRHTPHFSATSLNRGLILITIHLNPSAVICTNLHLITLQNETPGSHAEQFGLVLAPSRGQLPRAAWPSGPQRLPPPLSHFRYPYILLAKAWRSASNREAGFGQL